jgi:hypothetical protein
MRLLLSIAFVMAFATMAEARNEYLNNGSQACRYGDVSASIQGEDNNNDYRQPAFPNNNYDSDGDNYRFELRISKFLGISKRDCDRQNKILLENEELKQQLELLKVCTKYADRPLPAQFATVERMCAGLRARPVKEKSEDPLWDEMKKEYLKANPGADVYNPPKDSLKMPPKDFDLPKPTN